MGGIVIDIWEKSNFFRLFGSQKGAKKRDFCSGPPPLMVGFNIKHKPNIEVRASLS